MKFDQSARNTYIDASALIKYLKYEDGSEQIVEFINNNVNLCVTSICMSEALGALKAQSYNKQDPGYYPAVKKFMMLLFNGKFEIEDSNFHSNYDLIELIDDYSNKFQLDFSDAMQLVTIQHGKYSFLGPNSNSVFVSADKKLIKSARSLGIQTWDCLEDQKPNFKT
jgi:predicted nucleic acid-binding protein